MDSGVYWVNPRKGGFCGETGAVSVVERRAGLTRRGKRAILSIRIQLMADSAQLRTKRAERAGDFELRELRAFVALVEEGSVTAAARALKLSQSTVSETLAALERKLGTSVIHRRAGSHEMLLTPVGLALLPHARELLARAEETYVAVIEAAAEARGVVNIVANESVSTYVLPAVMAGLRARWPNTRFSISVATCADARRGIGDGTYDIGVTLQTEPNAAGRPSTTKEKSTLEIRQVLVPVVPLMVFAAPAHPLAAGKRREQVDKSELSEFAVFVSDPAGEFYESIEKFLSDGGGVPIAGIRSAGSVEGVKRGVQDDPQALGILPAYTLRDELRTRRIVNLRVTPALPALQLVASRSPIRDPHPAIFELMKDTKQVLFVRAQTA